MRKFKNWLEAKLVESAADWAKNINLDNPNWQWFKFVIRKVEKVYVEFANRLGNDLAGRNIWDLFLEHPELDQVSLDELRLAILKGNLSPEPSERIKKEIAEDSRREIYL